VRSFPLRDCYLAHLISLEVPRRSVAEIFADLDAASRTIAACRNQFRDEQFSLTPTRILRNP